MVDSLSLPRIAPLFSHPAMSQLSIREVTKRYSGHLALDKVSFEIPDKSIFGLLGPNGAGKTSLIRIINMITGADSGEIRIDDVPIRPSDVKRIGYLPEERGLYGKMKVLEQLVFFGRLKGWTSSDSRKVAIQWLKRMDLMDWRFKKAEELSKGMQQKVQFIITVMHRPELIILDEPFTGFDPINVEIIKEEIRRLRDDGATVIFSTHRMESVEEICDYMGMLNKSKKVLEGSIGEIKSQYKNSLVEVEFETNDIAKAGPLESYEETFPGRYKATLHAGDSKRLMINRLNEQVDLLSFKEHLPSIHEIFIQKVKEADHA